MQITFDFRKAILILSTSSKIDFFIVTVTEEEVEEKVPEVQVTAVVPWDAFANAIGMRRVPQMSNSMAKCLSRSALVPRDEQSGSST